MKTKILGIFVVMLLLTIIPSTSIAIIKPSSNIISKNGFAAPVIEQPKPGCIYFHDISSLYLQAFEYLNISGAIGKITIKVSHPDCENVSRIEFYVNNLKRWMDKSPPYSWTWRFSLMPLNVVKVVAISHTGETASAEILVYRLFLASLYSDIISIIKGG